MSNQLTKKSILKNVMEKIKKGKVKMKPRAYFILKSALLMVGVVMAAAAALYFASFTLFITRSSGLWFLPGYGFRGIWLFLGGFPWILLLGVACFIVLLELLAKRCHLVWRKPLLYSALAIVFFVVVTGLIIQQTPFHRNIYGQIQQGHLRLASPLYHRFEMPQPNEVHPGIVLEVVDNGFTIERPDGEVFKVGVSTSSCLRGCGEVREGDGVVVIGEIKGGVIEALGVHKAPGGGRFPLPPRQGPRRPGF